MNKPNTQVASATPTPWKVGQQSGLSVHILDEFGNTIATCQKYGAGFVPDGIEAPWHRAELNAALITKAVNCHDDLLSACKMVWEKFDSGTLCLEDFDEVKAAIHKATPQKEGAK